MKNISLFSLSVIIIVVFFFASCGKNKVGVCEFYYTYSYGNEYYCTIVDNSSECDTYGDNQYYDVWNSCNDLGYSVNVGVKFTSPSGSSYPGNNGHFTGGGGGSTPSYCTDTYQGPGVGSQLDSYCQTAYTYLCVGGYSENSEEVTSACDIYDAMNDNNYPNCGYCK